MRGLNVSRSNHSFLRFIITEKTRSNGGRKVEGVGVMKDKEIKLEEIEPPTKLLPFLTISLHTLGYVGPKDNLFHSYPIISFPPQKNLYYDTLQKSTTLAPTCNLVPVLSRKRVHNGVFTTLCHTLHRG